MDMMMRPTMVSLPFKLIFFVFVGGLTLVADHPQTCRATSTTRSSLRR
jgi:flagellar biosynthesis protein FliP